MFINAWTSPTGPNTASINVVCDANDTVAISGVNAQAQYQPTVGNGYGVSGGFSLWTVTGLPTNGKRTATVTVNGDVVYTLQVRGLYVGKPKRFYTTIVLSCDRSTHDAWLLEDVLERIEDGRVHPGVNSADLIIHLGDTVYKGWGNGQTFVQWGQSYIGTESGCPYANAVDSSDLMLWASTRVGVAKAAYREVCSRVPMVIQRDDHEIVNNFPVVSAMGFSDYTGFDPEGPGTPPNLNQTQIDAIFDNKKAATRVLLAANPGTQGAATNGDEEDYYFTEMGIKWLITDTTSKAKEQTGTGNRIISDAQQARFIAEINDPAPDILIHASAKTYYQTNGDGWHDYSAPLGTPWNGSNGQMLEFLEQVPDGTTQRFTSVTGDRHWGFASLNQQQGVDIHQLNPCPVSQELSNNPPPAEAINQGEWRTFTVGVLIYDTQTRNLYLRAIGYDGVEFYSKVLKPGTNVPTEVPSMATSGYIGYGPDEPFADTANIGGLTTTSANSNEASRAAVVPAGARITKVGFRGGASTAVQRSVSIGVYESVGGNPNNQPLVVSQTIICDPPGTDSNNVYEANLDAPFIVVADQEYTMAIISATDNVMKIADASADTGRTTSYSDSGNDKVLPNPFIVGPTPAVDRVVYGYWELPGGPGLKLPLVTDSHFVLGIGDEKVSIDQGTGAPTVGDSAIGIYLASVPLYQRQSIVGTLKVFKRYLLNQLNALSGATVLSGPPGTTNAGVVVNGTPGPGDLQLIVGADVVDNGRSHAIDETFAQLIAAFLEASTGN